MTTVRSISRFVISLDFELLWGVRDVADVATYRDNLIGERTAVGALLSLFVNRGIRATWATVGALCCSSKEELLRTMPDERPSYVDRSLSPYENLAEVGADERTDPLHFARSLVDRIVQTPGQELASHTFSHYYCLEGGQTASQFAADLAAARTIGKELGGMTRSLVFPRNQYNPAYRPELRAAGVRTYRSNGTSWMYRAATTHEPMLKRACRLLDAYVPLSGSRTAPPAAEDDFGLVDVPASAFLRPYRRSSRHLDRLRLRRLTSAIRTAAARGETFHLWWHPHNFGVDLAENVRFLEAVLDEFERHRRAGRMESAAMGDLAAQTVSESK